MRIGIECSLLLEQRSGIGQYLFHLITHLGRLDRSNEYVLLFFRESARKVEDFAFQTPRISFRSFPWNKWFLPLVTGFGRWTYPGLDRAIGQFDVFHWTHGLLYPRCTRKQILTVHDLSFLVNSAWHPLMRSIALSIGFRHAISKADRIIVPSHSTKGDVERYFGVPSGKVCVIYEAAAGQFRPMHSVEQQYVLSKYRLEPQEYVLFVGNIEPRKNVVRLLEAYALLLRKHTKPPLLVLAGGRGWCNKIIYKTLQIRNLESKVLFLGYVPDEHLPALMNGAMFLAYPSLYEGFGLPVLEAMACGTPVITSNVSSLPEIVGDAAVLIDPYNIEALADGLFATLNDQNLRTNLRQKGMERAQLFSWENTARQTLQVYEQVASL